MKGGLGLGKARPVATTGIFGAGAGLPLPVPAGHCGGLRLVVVVDICRETLPQLSPRVPCHIWG